MPLEEWQFGPPTPTTSPGPCSKVWPPFWVSNAYPCQTWTYPEDPWLNSLLVCSWRWICRNIWNLSFGIACLEFCCCLPTMPVFISLDNQCCNSFTTAAAPTGLEISSRHRLPTLPAHTGGETVPQQSPRQGNMSFGAGPPSPAQLHVYTSPGPALSSSFQYTTWTRDEVTANLPHTQKKSLASEIQNWQAIFCLHKIS